MFDPTIAVVERIYNKYLKNYKDQSVKIQLLSELRIIIYNLQVGVLDEDEALQYLQTYIDTLLGDDVPDNVKNNVIEELKKAIKIEEVRGKLRVPKKKFTF